MATEIFEPKEVYVGRDCGGADFEVTRELIDNYIASTGDDHPWYHGDSPLGGALAPALLLHSAAFRTSRDWYLPNLYGNLHARQEWQGFAPLRAGDKLRSRIVVVDRYVKRDRDYVVIECPLGLASTGQIVQRSRTHQSFLIEKAEGNGGGNGFAVDRAREKSGARVFHVGERGGEAIDAPMRKVTEAMCEAFSGPAKNYHTDREESIKLGFPEIVVQGMLSVCMIAAMMTQRFGLGFLIGGRFDVRLVNVLWCDEITGPRGRIIERRPEGNRTRAEVEVWCEKTDGTVTIIGTASALEL
jgi:acyl dehydratase